METLASTMEKSESNLGLLASIPLMGNRGNSQLKWENTSDSQV